ncbi:hypothetical protein HDV05_004763 [Chytridiales sp. JEL 0842]|nr:hypothetical protein HDV05_004763 [Chytridiales sp. JEL 0842]
MANILSFVVAFANKKSTVSILILLTFGFHLLGVFNTVMPLSRVVPLSGGSYWTILGGVIPILLSSELFIWILYIRFTAVSPLRQRHMHNFVRGYMVLESAFIFSIGVIWGLGGAVDSLGYLRKTAGRLYSYGSGLQAFTALMLSGYFVLKFYFPLLKGLKKSSLLVALYSSGLVYLLLETFLHLAFIITERLKATKDFSTGLNHLATAVRHSIFLVFIYRIRRVGSMSSGKHLLKQGHGDHVHNNLSGNSNHNEGGRSYSRASSYKEPAYPASTSLSPTASLPSISPPTPAQHIHNTTYPPSPHRTKSNISFRTKTSTPPPLTPASAHPSERSHHHRQFEDFPPVPKLPNPNSVQTTNLLRAFGDPSAYPSPTPTSTFHSKRNANKHLSILTDGSIEDDDGYGFEMYNSSSSLNEGGGVMSPSSSSRVETRAAVTYTYKPPPMAASPGSKGSLDSTGGSLGNAGGRGVGGRSKTPVDGSAGRNWRGEKVDELTGGEVANVW